MTDDWAAKANERDEFGATEEADDYRADQKPVLTAEDELRLCRRWIKGDLAARSRLVQSNLGLVARIARKYTFPGVDFRDLMQFGIIGLMIGIDRFDPERGWRLTSYVERDIIEAIGSYTTRESVDCRLPRELVRAVLRIPDAVDRLSIKFGRRPNDEDLRLELGISRTQWDRIRNRPRITVHLDAGWNGHLNETLDHDAHDWIADPRADDLAERMVENELAETIAKATGALEPDEHNVVRLTFGLDGGKVLGLKQIAGVLGLTEEAARRLKANAFEKLAKDDALRRLSDHQDPAIKPPREPMTAYELLGQHGHDLAQWLDGLSELDRANVTTALGNLHLSELAELLGTRIS